MFRKYAEDAFASPRPPARVRTAALRREGPDRTPAVAYLPLLHRKPRSGWLMLAAEMAGLASGNLPSPRSGWARMPRVAIRGIRADACSVHAARNFTVVTLRRWDTAERAQDIVVVVSELVTNALRHALPRAGDIRLRRPIQPHPIQLGLLQLGTCVLCAVADPSPAVPAPRTPGSLGETGRGLHIICALSDQWGYTVPSDAGKAVWATFYRRSAVPALAQR